MKNTLTTALALSVFLTSSFTNAKDYGNDRQNHQRKGPPPFESIDLDGDGMVTMSEFSEQKLPHGDHSTLFNHIDTNEDGVISETEFTNHKPPRRKRQ